MNLFSSSLLLLGVSSSCTAYNALRGGEAQQQQRQLQVLVISLENDTYTVIQDNRLDVDDPGFLGNDTALTGESLEVVDHIEVGQFDDDGVRVGDFQGDLRVEDDGEFRYDPPDADFIGNEVFEYKACLESNNLICAIGNVTIKVIRDPNKPDANPTAKDDSYEVIEGNTLKVDADEGFLDNDETGEPSNPLFRCERNGDTEGDLDTEEDGSFEYEIPKCWTGEDKFTYRACYVDFEEMQSNEATVTVTVKEDPNRPMVPEPDDDTYGVYEAETVTVNVADGLLWNDVGGELLYVNLNNIEKREGFVGDLSVNEDGSLTYTAISGELGNMVFDYEVCQRDWEECVACSEGTVTIQVTANPNKPDTAPLSSLSRQSFVVEVGQVLSGNIVTDNVDFDSRYTVEVSNAAATVGTINLLDDTGNYQYGNAPVGSASITYTACYVEWPDLCADGTMAVEIVPGSSAVNNSTSRQGVATYYEVSWVGSAAGECGAVTPSVKLSCAAGGALETIVAGPSDNASCNMTAFGELVCDAKNSGVVYMECRDESGRNNTRRQLIAELTSPSVACGGINPPYQASHYMSHRVWCNETWSAGTIETCSGGTLLTDATTGRQLCYGDESTLAASAKPADLTMTANNFETCTDFGLGPSAAGEPGTLTIIGDSVEDEDDRLQACQADCDDDDECAPGLVCFQRRGNEPVPGCVGTPVEGRDYCVYPVQDDLVIIARSGGSK